MVKKSILARCIALMVIGCVFIALAACNSQEPEPEVTYLPYDGIADGNAFEYSVENTPPLKNSPIAGNTYFFLGSSVTLGYGSKDESMADFLAKRNNCTAVKEAVSGTTLADNGSDSYVQRLKNFDPNTSIDGFILQLSTNDASSNSTVERGVVTPAGQLSDFDTETTYGALEYIISYAKETWNCPIYVYTNAYYENKAYAEMVEAMDDIVEKWDIVLIDLYRDETFNDVSSADHFLYMGNDPVHPNRAGYRLWWTPVFEDILYAAEE